MSKELCRKEHQVIGSRPCFHPPCCVQGDGLTCEAAAHGSPPGPGSSVLLWASLGQMQRLAPLVPWASGVQRQLPCRVGRARRKR